MGRATFARNASYDGLFYVCVRSTGIFCRPSCPARKPLPCNVDYHATIRDCLRAGFRPCKRCRPLAAAGEAPDWLVPLLSRVEKAPTERITNTNLRDMGADPDRVRRYFQRHFGLTFQAYHRMARMGLAIEFLRRGDDPLHVAYDLGYDSPSGFRAAFEKTFGTTPGKCDHVQLIQTTTIPTPIGPMLAAAGDRGLCLLEFADRRALPRQIAMLRRRTGGGVFVPGTNPFLRQLRVELNEYFAGKRQDFPVACHPLGTNFQMKVWAKLCEIPCGTTWSYRDLARAIGQPTACRAVARANGDNRLAILIPCHRVVRDNGTLCGYGGGLWRKQFLLDLEGNAANADRRCTRQLQMFST